MSTPGLFQMQIDCALIHLRAAKDIAALVPTITTGHLQREIQLGIDRLEDRWGT